MVCEGWDWYVVRLDWSVRVGLVCGGVAVICTALPTNLQEA